MVLCPTAGVILEFPQSIGAEGGRVNENLETPQLEGCVLLNQI